MVNTIVCANVCCIQSLFITRLTVGRSTLIGSGIDRDPDRRLPAEMVFTMMPPHYTVSESNFLDPVNGQLLKA